MKLYYLKGACSFVPHTALEWVYQQTGKRYEAVAATREMIKSPEYLALNPQGAVPLLIDGDLALSQNVAILFYLDMLHPEVKLFGSHTAQDKAKAMRWLSFFNADLHKLFSGLFHLPAYLSENEQLANQARQATVEKILGLLEIADEHLDHHQYFGETISVADIYLYIELCWCKGLGIDFSHLRHLNDFIQRIEANSGVDNVRQQQGLK